MIFMSPFFKQLRTQQHRKIYKPNFQLLVINWFEVAELNDCNTSMLKIRWTTKVIKSKNQFMLHQA